MEESTNARCSICACGWSHIVVSLLHPHAALISITVKRIARVRYCSSDVWFMFVAAHLIEWCWVLHTFSVFRVVMSSISSSRWLSLITPLRTQAFSYCDLHSLRRIPSVCTTWHDAITQNEHAYRYAVAILPDPDEYVHVDNTTLATWVREEQQESLDAIQDRGEPRHASNVTTGTLDLSPSLLSRVEHVLFPVATPTLLRAVLPRLTRTRTLCVAYIRSHASRLQAERAEVAAAGESEEEREQSKERVTRERWEQENGEEAACKDTHTHGQQNMEREGKGRGRCEMVAVWRCVVCRARGVCFACVLICCFFSACCPCQCCFLSSNHPRWRRSSSGYPYP